MAQPSYNFDIEADPKRITAILHAQETQVINKRSNGTNEAMPKTRGKDNNPRSTAKRSQVN